VRTGWTIYHVKLSSVRRNIPEDHNPNQRCRNSNLALCHTFCTFVNIFICFSLVSHPSLFTYRINYTHLTSHTLRTYGLQ